MTFNSDKFECLRYCADPTMAPKFQYLAPDSQPIKVKEDLRDLGVMIRPGNNSQLSCSLACKAENFCGNTLFMLKKCKISEENVLKLIHFTEIQRNLLKNWMARNILKIYLTNLGRFSK